MDMVLRQPRLSTKSAAAKGSIALKRSASIFYSKIFIVRTGFTVRADYYFKSRLMIRSPFLEDG